MVLVAKKNQSGMGFVEAILIIALMVAIGYTIYHFGWGAQDRAKGTITASDIKTVQIAVDAFVLQSNGQFPTDNSQLPASDGKKLIIWDAKIYVSAKYLAFFPDFISRLPKRWNEGIWYIDGYGRVLTSG